MNKTILQVETIEAGQLLNEFGEIKNSLSEIKEFLQNRPVEIMKREAVAKFFGVSLTTIHDWVKKGILTKHQTGHLVYFKRSEVERALVEIKPKKANR